VSCIPVDRDFMVLRVSVFTPKYLNVCMLAVNMCNSFPSQTAARSSYLVRVIVYLSFQHIATDVAPSSS
jgi:hypothetical protein